MRISALLTGVAAALAAATASAEMTGNTIKIGVLNDQSSLYADLSGQGSVVAARMAIEDFGGSVNGTPVEVVSADHQNKPDVGSNIARQWYDVEEVDMIVDVPNSAVALAVNEVTREKNKAFLNSGAATSALTGDKCSPNTGAWTYDTWALANGTGKAVVQTGGDSWFFITADYAFGHALKDTSEVVKENGGTVVGAVRHPLNTADFSSFLLQAQSSGAKVIGLANAGGDTTNSIKQASEFGIVESGQQLAALPCSSPTCTRWGRRWRGRPSPRRSTGTRTRRPASFAKELPRQYRGIHPTMVHAGVYSATLHYLKALAAPGSDGDGAAVVAKIGAADRRHPVRPGHDPRGRAQDPRHVPVPGQDARGEQGRVGLLHVAGHDPRGRGVPPTRRGRLPARQVVSRAVQDEEAGDAPPSLGIPPQALFGQLLLGLINGAFYATLSLAAGHLRPPQHHQLRPRRPVHDGRLPPGSSELPGATMVGAGPGPLAVGLVGIVIERTMLKRLYKLDHLYGLLLTFGLALIIEGLFRHEFGLGPALRDPGPPGRPQPGLHVPADLPRLGGGGLLAVCLLTWFVVERTKLGAYLRAATENPTLVQAFGSTCRAWSRSPTASAWRSRRSPACSRRRSTRSTRPWARA